ncbi:MAG: RNA polymerase sigma factor [Acidimicrobiia bacterium]|nr:RNA polymerase sigma factor [Acidimicrobiia bacterium]
MGIPHEVSDRELIVAAVEGDRASFGRLIARYQGDALRIAAVALGSADGADDVAQEAFVKIHRALSRFDLTAPFRPWLYRIVVNTARSRQRTGRQQNNLRLRMAATIDPHAGDDPADRAVELDQRQSMVEALNRLRPDDRLILTYRWFEQLSQGEIANALGCRPGTVKSRLNRAMHRLRSEMRES